MIGTEFLRGQGLGNQLFCYVTARAIARERGCAFGTAGRKNFANNIHSNRGMYFMDVDLGEEIPDEQIQHMKRFDDADDRLYMGTCRHDLTHGCYVSGVSEAIHQVEDDTLLYGNLQAQDYFASSLDQLGNWLKLRPEADIHEYTRDDLCIVNLRGGEYTSEPALYLDRSYFIKAMARMREKVPSMEFMVITEDVEAAKKVLPELPAFHLEMGGDYAAIKNARFLIVSNSSFAVLPALTNTELRYAIAPKYWARHNVSDGYWASEQNIYDVFTYMDRKGELYSACECRIELEGYKQRSAVYGKLGVRPTGVLLAAEKIREKTIYTGFTARKILRKIERETGIIKKR